MTIKKFFGLLSLFGLFLLMIVNPVTAEEISGAIYSEDNLIAKASEGVVSVPVYMENDPGLMGYVLQFDYDPNVLTPSEVKQGDILQSGNFNDNIEGDATEGSFKVMWNHAESVAENGLLFDIEFEIAKEAKDSTEIQVTALSSDTYNEEFEPANLNCRNIPIEIEHIHKFGEWRIVQAATCSGEGVAERVCEICQEREEQIVERNPDNHVPGEMVQENMIPATFESEGSYEAVIYCSDCGAEISRETVVVAKTADFRELSTAVDEVIKDITQTKISEDGTDVGIDEVWVKQADADIMLNTLASAMKITSDLNVSQEEVDQVRNQLLEAREAFDSAKSYGYAEQSGEINPQSDTSALSTAVSDIMAMQVGIRISVDGTDVEPEASWVTSTVSERLMQKLNEAIAMLGDNSVLQEEVDRMKSELSSESELYRNAIRKGSKKPQQKIIEVVKKDLTAATIKLEKSTYKYTGSAIIPKVTVILGNKQLREGTDYGVSCTANLNVGLATATVTGKGDYIGSLSESFTIDPVGTEITSIKKMKKGFKVKFKKQTNDISGYEIEYSKNKKFKKGTKSVLVKNTASTKKINKLKSKKKYYVRIRTYKDVGGVRYYSSWSKTKKVKTK